MYDIVSNNKTVDHINSNTILTFIYNLLKHSPRNHRFKRVIGKIHAIIARQLFVMFYVMTGSYTL